jgi:hypothetical protein
VKLLLLGQQVLSFVPLLQSFRTHGLWYVKATGETGKTCSPVNSGCSGNKVRSLNSEKTKISIFAGSTLLLSVILCQNLSLVDVVTILQCTEPYICHTSKYLELCGIYVQHHSIYPWITFRAQVGFTFHKSRAASFLFILEHNMRFSDQSRTFSLIRVLLIFFKTIHKWILIEAILEIHSSGL